MQKTCDCHAHRMVRRIRVRSLYIMMPLVSCEALSLLPHCPRYARSAREGRQPRVDVCV